MKFPIAIQLFSLRDEANADLYGTLKKVRAMGYEGIELAGLCNHTPEEIREMCAELSLTPVSAHIPYDDLLLDTKKTLADYAAIGCRYGAIPFLIPEHRPGTEQFPIVIENIRRFCVCAKQYGIQMLYHNHNFEFAKVGQKYALDIIYETLPGDLLQTEIDTCWVNAAGIDPSAYLLKYTGRSPLVHIKDFYGKESEEKYQETCRENVAPLRITDFEYRSVGSGMQEIPKLLQAASQAGVEWLIVEQDGPTPDLTPMECAAASCSYLKACL